jgi:type II secretory pathway pseudopilin PulG
MLAAIAIPNFVQRRTAAEFAQARADMQSIKLGLEAYQVDRLDYPWMNTVNSALGGGEGLFAWSLPTLERLTTPVAYVSGSPFYDPFPATHCYYGSDLESIRDTTSAPYMADAFK